MPEHRGRRTPCALRNKHKGHKTQARKATRAPRERQRGRGWTERQPYDGDPDALVPAKRLAKDARAYSRGPRHHQRCHDAACAEGPESGSCARMATDSMTRKHVSQDITFTKTCHQHRVSQHRCPPHALHVRALVSEHVLVSGTAQSKCLSRLLLSSTRNLICLCSNTQPAARNGRLRVGPVYGDDGRWLQHDYYPRR